MTNYELKSGTLPFQISDIPKGIIMNPEGLHISPYTQGTVVLRLEGKPAEPEIDLKVIAGAHSHVKIVLFQNIESKCDLRLSIFCTSDESARVDFIQFHLGGAKVHVSLIQETAGPHAELNTDLLSRTRKSQKYQFLLNNNFVHKNGKGKTCVKSIALDEGVIDARSTIHISRKGGGTEATLRQDSLLLSENARVHAVPGLKIETSDVKAGHGASVTNLNDESLFYLVSRGIDEKTARKMMVSGFAAEQLDKINGLPELKKEIMNLI